MFNPWYEATMLAIESNSVVYLRMIKLATGGLAASDEAHQMVREKIDAAFEAFGTLLSGGTAATVVGRLREHVAANVERLSPV